MKALSPDAHGDGLLQGQLDPLRYDYHTNDPAEVAGMIAARVPLRCRVLDVGCGTGAMAKLLVDTCGVTIVGVEPDPDRAALAQARGLEVHRRVFEGSWIENLGRFDVVLFADVLEHLAEPAVPLRLAHTVLNRGGYVIASVPNVAHWTVRWELLRGRFDYAAHGIMDSTHLRWFTERSLRRLFQATGYRVEDLGVTLGAGLDSYRTRFPWRHLSERRLRRLLLSLRRGMPRLFGCQFVVRARHDT
jgi:methionine biosynthesis protein MetW